MAPTFRHLHIAASRAEDSHDLRLRGAITEFEAAVFANDERAIDEATDRCAEALVDLLSAKAARVAIGKRAYSDPDGIPECLRTPRKS